MLRLRLPPSAHHHSATPAQTGPEQPHGEQERHLGFPIMTTLMRTGPRVEFRLAGGRKLKMDEADRPWRRVSRADVERMVGLLPMAPGEM